VEKQSTISVDMANSEMTINLIEGHSNNGKTIRNKTNI